MATFTDGSYITNKGNTLNAKLLASRGELRFERATIGVGEIPDGLTPETMTDLTQYKMDGWIANIGNPQDGEASVVVQASSIGVPEGFNATQLILWATDPDDGLIAHTFLYLASAPEWIRPQTDPVGKIASFNLNTLVSNIPLVNATINPLALARAIDLIGHINQSVFTEEGVHDIRFWLGIWQVWNGAEWISAGAPSSENDGFFGASSFGVAQFM